MMRDEPLNAPIRRPEPSDYHDRKLVECAARLREVLAWTPEEASRSAHDHFQTRLAEIEAEKARRAAIRARYEAMLACVEAWIPPLNGEHDELKTFMKKQLRESIEFDCFDPGLVPRERSGDVFRSEEIERTTKDIAYHQAEREKEHQRTAGRVRWIDQLAKSIGEPPQTEVTR